jgi:hypothetical protein
MLKSLISISASCVSILVLWYRFSIMIQDPIIYVRCMLGIYRRDTNIDHVGGNVE